MTLRSSLAVFGLGSAFAWASFLLIFLTVPPESAGLVGGAFFFSSLFLATAGTLTILGILGRTRASALLPALHAGPAFRQGTLLAFSGVSLLVLQRFRLLNWWSALGVVLGVALLDLVCSRRTGMHAPAAVSVPHDTHV